MSDEAAPIYDDKKQVRGSLDLSNATWQHGDADERGEHIEVAKVLHTDGVTYVAMRKSTEPDGPDGPVLVFTPGEWDAFVKGAAAGEFDKLW